MKALYILIALVVAGAGIVLFRRYANRWQDGKIEY